MSDIRKQAKGILELAEKATPIPYYADGKDIFAAEKQGAPGLRLYAKIPITPKEGEIAPPSFAVKYIEGASSIAYIIAAANDAPELARAVLALKNEGKQKDGLIERQQVEITRLQAESDQLASIREWIAQETTEYAESQFSTREIVQDIYRRLQRELQANVELREADSLMLEMTKLVRSLRPTMDELYQRSLQTEEYRRVIGG